jgi:hypothetical protein
MQLIYHQGNQKKPVALLSFLIGVLANNLKMTRLPLAIEERKSGSERANTAYVC